MVGPCLIFRIALWGSYISASFTASDRSAQVICPEKAEKNENVSNFLLLPWSLSSLQPVIWHFLPSHLFPISHPSGHSHAVTSCFGFAPIGIFLSFLQQISVVNYSHTEGKGTSCVYDIFGLCKSHWAGPPVLQSNSDPVWKHQGFPWDFRLQRISVCCLTGDGKRQSVLPCPAIVFRIFKRLRGNEISLST